jgi:hypothetical protein
LPRATLLIDWAQAGRLMDGTASIELNEYHCRQLSWIIRLVRDYFEDRLPRSALSQFLGMNESGAG